MKLYYFPVVFFAVIFFLGLMPNKATMSYDSPVEEILTILGDGNKAVQPDITIPGTSVDAGEGIVKFGLSHKNGGKKNKKQSKSFVCTACHNIEREDPDLKKPDPEARLDYVIKKGIPFLQGTTLYGAINRRSYYNGDYEKKYGDLVRPARRNLREAIQLCAVECSQGRALKPWEMESVVAYLHTIGYKVSDLITDEEEYALVYDAVENNGDKEYAIFLLKSKYIEGSPAHFIEPPSDRDTGLGYKGDPENGKLIYDHSCKHCHLNRKYSFYKLDDTKLTFRHLKKTTTKDSRYSIYNVVRHGTSPKMWKKAYMPQYTIEKMSNQQVEDLRAYIDLKCQ
jgi:mono/diheme cytochrome c family protein